MSLVPAATKIFARYPSSYISKSTVALSVTISAITSPGDSLSPSYFNHFIKFPLSMVGDNLGIIKDTNYPTA